MQCMPLLSQLDYTVAYIQPNQHTLLLRDLDTAIAAIEEIGRGPDGQANMSAMSESLMQCFIRKALCYQATGIPAHLVHYSQ